MLYAVYIQYDDGPRRLMYNGADLSKEDATALIKSIEDRQTKPHKASYGMVCYKPGMKRAVLAEEKIAV